MNIINYKWPAVAAASLHGALLILFPSAPHRGAGGPTVREITLGPLPPDNEPVVVADDEKAADTLPQKAPSRPVVAELPEDPATPLVDDRPIMKIPIPNRPTMGPISTTLVDFRGDESGPDTGGPGPVTIKDLDRVPRATVQASPRYPENMKKDGMAGSVVVEFYVDASGRVYRAEATSFSHSSFVEPAVRAVLQWRFEPGRRNNRPVPFRMVVPVEFTLPEN